MKRFWMAFMTVVALSAGILWAEGQHAKTDKAMDCGSCCCAKSCAK